MIERSLVIHEFEDFVNSAGNHKHFSSTKGFQFAIGLSKHIDVFYLTTGESVVVDGVNLISIEDILDEGIDSFDLLIITREHIFPQLFEYLPSALELMQNEERKTVILHKGDSFGWIKNKDFRKTYYAANNQQSTVFADIGRLFDVICAQTESLAEFSFQYLPEKIHQVVREKIFISRMGVPEVPPYQGRDKESIDLYSDKNSFCVDNWTVLKSGSALSPLCFTNIHLSHTSANIDKFNENKTRLLYMGRMKTDNGKTIDLMKEIMLELGPEYELHIFPGRYRLPRVPVSVFSPKSPINIQLLRDCHFAECENVIVHYPFDSLAKDEVLGSMDIGIDFSQARPLDSISIQGNAKILEYCYYGLKVVTESNVQNSNLIIESGSGLILDGLPEPAEFAEAIIETTNIDVDWKDISQYTIEQHSWRIIAGELLEHCNKIYMER